MGGGGEGRRFQKLTPSLSLIFIPTIFTVWRLKSRYGHITCSNMHQYEKEAPKRREIPRRQLNSHFLSKPLKQGNGPGHGERALGAKIIVRMDPSPFLLGSSVDDFECLAEKQKLKIDCNFQFSIFRLPPTEKLSHATNCSIVGKAKLPLSFIFLFIVDRIKVKIQYSIKRKKSQKFSIWHFRFFYDKK